MLIGESHPELLADLEKIPAMQRVERLRTLASIGYATLRGKSSVVVDSTQLGDETLGIGAESQESKKAGDSPAFGGFIDGLLGSTTKR